jgi:group I intron endonuclease
MSDIQWTNTRVKSGIISTNILRNAPAVLQTPRSLTSHRRADMNSLSYKQSGIYAIVNNVNGKRYIGSAVDISHRWDQHVSDLRKGKHKNKHLQSAWNKYGEGSFNFKVIECCDKTALIQREQFYIDTLIPEYNKAKTAGSMLGFRHTPESKLKISRVQKGKKLSLLHRLKIGLAQIGRTASEETRKKLSIASKNISKEAQARTGAINRIKRLGKTGYKHTAEALKKIADAARGNKNYLGRKHTPEEIQRMKDAWKTRSRYVSPETREKMSKSAKAYQARKRKEKEENNG